METFTTFKEDILLFIKYSRNNPFFYAYNERIQILKVDGNLEGSAKPKSIWHEKQTFLDNFDSIFETDIFPLIRNIGIFPLQDPHPMVTQGILGISWKNIYHDEVKLSYYNNVIQIMVYTHNIA